ncbi:MAG: hypothetical protein WCP93_01715 [Candidatus Berkelbacteria bacterium]
MSVDINEVAKAIQESKEVIFFGRSFITAEFAQVMSIGEDGKGLTGRIGVTFYLKTAGVNFTTAAQLFPNKKFVDGKVKNEIAESWDQLGSFNALDMRTWCKLANVLGKTVHYYVDISGGTGCEYAKVVSFYPQSE